MYYKLQIEKDFHVFDYPVEDVEKIRGAKYNEEMTECVCYYSEQLEESDRVKQITEEEYNSY